MRILAIRGQNLASLARSFEVDLVHGPLAGVGLFAITGPVGSGKSTLLDALCLPLFDRTPRLSGRGGAPIGDEGENPNDWLRANDPRTLLRRDAAAGHAEVDFVGRDGVRYRAHWSVRRARRRADGRVQEQELLLTDLDRGVVVAGGRRSDVLAAIQQRLGLDFAQFCRSVLLAQGDFAAFLHAAADERAKLLETLTGADVYRRLSKAAHERARLHAHEVELLEAQFAAQAPLAAAERAAVERAVDQLTSQLGTCRVAIELASRYVTWHDAAARHRQGESEAVVQLQAAVAAHDAAAGRREALERRQRAMAVVPRWEVAMQAAAAARAATSAAAAAREHRVRCETLATAARRQLQGEFQRAFAEPLGADVPAVVREFPQWEPLLQAWQRADAAAAAIPRTLPGLERVVLQVEEQLGVARTEVERLAAARLAALAAVASAQAAAERVDQEALAAARRTLEAERNAAQQAQAHALAWRAADEARARLHSRSLQLAAECRSLQQAVARHRERREAAAAQRDRARERWELLRSHTGLAALRAGLVRGEPCPLCGATEHALPAGPVDADVAAAARTLADCEHELAAAERELGKAQGDDRASTREHERALADVAAADLASAQAAAAARAAVAGGAGAAVGDPAAALARAAERVAANEPALAQLAATEAEARAVGVALQGAVRGAASAQDAWQRAEDRRRALEQQGRDAVRARDQAVAAMQAEQTRSADLQAALAGACAGLAGGVQALAAMGGDRVAVLRALHARHRAGEETERAVAAAAAGERDAEAAGARALAEEAGAARGLAKALALAAVADEDVAAVAELGAEALALEAQALRELADEVERCRTVLRERVNQRRRHEDHERPSLDAPEAAAALQDARASADVVQRRLTDARVQLGADDLVRRQREELAPRLAAAEARRATWQALDDLIGSSTGDAFAVFAQGLTLDLLLLEANRRLAELARRYRLQKNPEAALDFVVVDLDLGGTRRSLQTLSGGETFLVSLALALALATLAAPRSRVETLFLDEGFGTLDAASLEVALGALDSLQATGCQVGVISHVDGIAERIGAQVVVQPEGGGQSRVFAQAR